MPRILFSLLVALLLCLPAYAQGTLARPSGYFANPGSIGDANATFFTLTGNPSLGNERLLTFTPRFTTVDNGPGMTYVVDLATVALGYGGTGATTQLGAVNSILGFAGVASGDTIYYNGTNWVRLPVGLDAQVLTLTGGLPVWSSSGVSSPADSAFIVQALSATLTQERRLQGTAGDITLTDGGANADMVIGIGTNVVTLTGTQLLTNKTLTGPAFSWNGGNGVTLKGQVNDTILNWADFASSKTITFPDITGTVVLTEGNQTIAGTKTFTLAPTLTSGTLTAGANLQTFPSTAQTLVGRTSTDTLTNKTITSPILQTQVTLDQTTADYTLTWANPAAGRAYEIRDIQADGDFAMTHQTATYTDGGIAFANGNTIDFTPVGTTGQSLISQGTGDPIWGTAGATGGGTGQTTYVTGDTLYASAANTLSRRAIGATGDVLTVTGGVPVWAAPATIDPVAALDPVALIRIYDDFTAIVTPTANTSKVCTGVTLIGQGGAGATAGSSQSGHDVNHQGIAALTVKDGGDSAHVFGEYMKLTGGALTFSTAVGHLSAVSDGTNTYTIHAGIADNLGTSVTDAVVFRYAHSTNSGNWQCVCLDDTVETVINTSTAPSTSGWQTLKFVVNSAATSVEFFIDGVSQGSITTDIPDNDDIGIRVMIDKSAGTATRVLKCDYVYCTKAVAR